MSIYITICPVCNSPKVYQPGLPPAKRSTNWTNRCTSSELTGDPGCPANKTRGKDSWWPPKRHPGRKCRAPLTNQAGEPIPAIDWLEFVRLTRDKFDVEALYQRAERLAEEGAEPKKRAGDDAQDMGSTPWPFQASGAVQAQEMA